MNEASQSALDYKRIEEALGYLEQNFRRQPELQEIAGYIGLSDFHFQKLFKRWVGISPKRFLQYLTKEYAKSLLDRAENILDVTYTSGLSSPGRLHDLFVQCEAITPGEYKNKGMGLQIFYGIHQSPFGDCLLARTNRGICGLYFLGKREESPYTILKRNWPQAEFVEENAKTRLLITEIFDTTWNKEKPFRLLLKGTNFQIKVWEALLKIPAGCVVSYQDIARNIGHAKAVRAVGSAVASNRISYLIPCHRVIQKSGQTGNYQGGPIRKKAILGWEMARTVPEELNLRFSDSTVTD